MSDQIAAKSYLNYQKTSDLSDEKTAIQNATAAFSTIASNRGTLLVKAGLTDEEIKKKVEADMPDLDS